MITHRPTIHSFFKEFLHLGELRYCGLCLSRWMSTWVLNDRGHLRPDR